MSLFIGLMSGTSMDGVDAALIDFSKDSFLAGLTRPYSKPSKQYLNAVLNGELSSLKNYSQLNTLLGREFAAAVKDLLEKVQLPAKAIEAIGSHGQTVCHDPEADIPYTLQLGCPHTIAELTGITVVADFRTRDLVIGGQGAPFAPIYHQILFKGQGYPLAIVNIGGIANLTYLIDEFKLSGYDFGPGNCLMDAWIHKNLGDDYDKEGSWAQSGKVIATLLEKLLADPYFQRKEPKSAAKEYFSLSWLAQHLEADYAPANVQATLLRLTALAIAQGIQKEALIPKRLFLCGGGVHNTALVNTLRQLLPEMDIQSTESIHINPDYIEALLFAWLAKNTLSKTPLDLTEITGARYPTILGAIYPN